MSEPAEIPPPPWRRPRRATRRRRPLSQERIVDTAMRLLDSAGLASLSMRSVALELGTGPASLYAHVSGKDELLELMVDRVIGEIEIPEADPARWRDQLIELAYAMHGACTRHNGIARAALAKIPVGPNSLRFSEGVLAILRAGRVPDQAAAWFVDRLVLCVLADAFEGGPCPERERGTGAEVYLDQLRGYYQSLPPDVFPNISRLIEPLMAGAGRARFEFGVRLMVDGLAQLGGDDRAAFRGGDGRESAFES